MACWLLRHQLSHVLALGVQRLAEIAVDVDGGSVRLGAAEQRLADRDVFGGFVCPRRFC